MSTPPGTHFLDRFISLQPLVEAEHLRDEGNHPVVAGFAGRVGEADGAKAGTFRPCHLPAKK